MLQFCVFDANIRQESNFSSFSFVQPGKLLNNVSVDPVE